MRSNSRLSKALSVGLTVSVLLHAALGSPAQFPLSMEAGTSATAPITTGDKDMEVSNTAPVGWYDPRAGGGRMLDFTTKTRGEPLNVIISGLSDPFVLTDEGFEAYARSIGYARECMGLHWGNVHKADLGDGDGRKPEVLLYRQHYKLPGWGTCWESFAGGQHFRAWKQNGTAANSGAWFLGASKEEDGRRGHTIVANGWNIGRDWLVEQTLAESQPVWVPYGALSPQSLATLRPRGDGSGDLRSEQWPWPETGGERIQWSAVVEWRVGLLEPGKKGINHNIPQDGVVAILTISRVTTDQRLD